MLTELQVKNFAIIDDAALRFKEGLNILTGETGAGKTLVIEAINLLIGERADSTLIRDGEDRLLVQGYFDFRKNNTVLNFLKERNLLDRGNSETVITRELNRVGKNKAFINGIFVQVNTLKELSALFIDIHGQHDHQYLLEPKTHINIIDRFGKQEIEPAKESYLKSLSSYKQKKAKLDKLVELQGKKEDKLVDLKYRLDEIESLNIKQDEESKLENEKRILKNHEQIYQLSSNIIDIIKGGTEEHAPLGDSLALLEKNLGQLANIDENFKKFEEEVSSVAVIIEELSHYINSYIADFDYSAERLDFIQERLYRLSEIKKKYGMDLASIQDYAGEIREEINNFENIDSQIEKAETELKQQEEDLRKKALNLFNLRNQVSEKIEESIKEELGDLNFKDINFRVNHNILESRDGIRLNGKKAKLTSEGVDDIEFLISLNIGEEVKPLKKIASGGEVSRIMLALKSIIGTTDFISTMIFDEIDTGIGGSTSVIVGEKLYKIGKSHQVICITHLAQIASFADSHYFIEKYAEGGRTKIRVKELGGESKDYEIARMLSGMGNNEISLKHAKELIKKCQQKKDELK
ncbi:MAG: DNA repair protein RecN [Candidatus Humimicrobiaceae bacterium]